MHFLRRAALLVSSILLKLALTVLAVSFAAVIVFGSPDQLKRSLEQSGVYNQVVKSALDSAQREQNDSDEMLPLERPEIRQAAEAAFSPGTLKGWAEEIIDSFYGWLEGKTSKPEFQIDAAGARQTFIQKVADYAETRLNSLQPCTMQENVELSRRKIDPLSVQCRPPVDINTEKQRLITELETSEDFLPDSTFTSEDLLSENRSSNFEDHPAPDIYQRAKSLPLFLGFLTILLAAAVIFASVSRREGLKRVFITFLGTGIFLLVGSLLINYFFGSMNSPGGSLGKLITLDDKSLQGMTLAVIRSLFNAFSNKIIFISAAYVAIGGIGLIVLARFWRIPQHGAAHLKQPEDSAKTLPDYPPDTDNTGSSEKPAT